jgi:geranylgeranyl pyrophosphate synthase
MFQATACMSLLIIVGNVPTVDDSTKAFGSQVGFCFQVSSQISAFYSKGKQQVQKVMSSVSRAQRIRTEIDQVKLEIERLDQELTRIQEIQKKNDHRTKELLKQCDQLLDIIETIEMESELKRRVPRR